MAPGGSVWREHHGLTCRAERALQLVAEFAAKVTAFKALKKVTWLVFDRKWHVMRYCSALSIIGRNKQAISTRAVRGFKRYPTATLP
jgi:hypothetical protein